MGRNAIPTLRFIAISSATLIIGEYTMITCQVIGISLKTKSIGGYTVRQNNGRTLLSPLKIVKGEGACVDELIADWVHQHVLLLDRDIGAIFRSEEHTSELQSQSKLVCRL